MIPACQAILSKDYSAWMNLYSRETHNQKGPFSGLSVGRTTLLEIWPVIQTDLSEDFLLPSCEKGSPLLRSN